MAKKITIDASFFNKAYLPYLRKTKRFNVTKGGRGSGKTDFYGSKICLYLAKNPGKKVLIIVKTASTVRQGIMDDLREICKRFGLSDMVNFKVSPLEIRFSHEGEEDSIIEFRGADDPEKVKGIAGYDILWFEEANNISATFFMSVIFGFRSPVRDGAIYITFNPESEDHWLKKFFFDKAPGSDFVKTLKDKKGNIIRDEHGNPKTIQTYETLGGFDADEILTLTTTYRDNHFGGNKRVRDNYIKLFKAKKIENIHQWDVWANGNWGTSGDRVFNNFIEFEFDHQKMFKENKGLYRAFGMDKGIDDPYTFVASYVDKEAKKIYIYEEMSWYQQELPNIVVKDITARGYKGERIFVDSAEPTTNNLMRQYGLKRLENAKKPPGSIHAGVVYLKQYEIIVHPNCKGLLKELKSYQYKEKTNKDGTVTKGYDENNNHFIDALRYSMQEVENDGSSVKVRSRASLGLRF